MSNFWASAALCAALLSPAAWAAAPVYGDADGNGVVNIEDARLLARIAGGLAPATANATRQGDVAPLTDYEAGVFGDGKITLADADRLMRRLNGKEPSEWPAKANYYQLQPGNTFTVIKKNAAGETTGEVTSTVQPPVEETRGGVTYIISPVTGSDGSEQRLVTGIRSGGNIVPFTDSQGRRALGATRFTFNDGSSAFDPPLVVLVYPVQAGTTWTGTTQTTVDGLSTTASYTGTISGPETVTVPAGTFANAYKVSLAYSGSLGPLSVTGQEDYWFAPYLGPVQHGFTRTIRSFLGNQTKTIQPDVQLSAANVHGVQYP